MSKASSILTKLDENYLIHNVSKKMSVEVPADSKLGNPINPSLIGSFIFEEPIEGWQTSLTGIFKVCAKDACTMYGRDKGTSYVRLRLTKILSATPP